MKHVCNYIAFDRSMKKALTILQNDFKEVHDSYKYILLLHYEVELGYTEHVISYASLSFDSF